MNFRHVKLSGWSGMALASYIQAVGVGVYGRNRVNFSTDFTYNKYHFGVFTNIVSGAGLMLSSKMVAPWQSGVFFISAILNLSFPSYYEGYMDLKDEPFEGDTSFQRKIGLYSLIIGSCIIWKKYWISLKYNKYQP